MHILITKCKEVSAVFIVDASGILTQVLILDEAVSI